MAAGCLTWGSIRATWLDALKSVPRGPLGMRRTSPLPTAAAHAPRDTFALREPSSRFLVRPGLACLTSVPLAEKTVSSVLQGSTSPEPVKPNASLVRPGPLPHGLDRLRVRLARRADFARRRVPTRPWCGRPVQQVASTCIAAPTRAIVARDALLVPPAPRLGRRAVPAARLVRPAFTQPAPTVSASLVHSRLATAAAASHAPSVRRAST